MRKLMLLIICIVLGNMIGLAQGATQINMDALRQKKREAEFQNQTQMRKSKLNFYLNNWE